MDPEIVTLKQLFSSFTAKHFVTTVTTVFSLLATIFFMGYWIGKNYTESQLAVQQVDLRNALSQTQRKLEVTENRSEQLMMAISQWQAAYQKTQAALAQQQQEIVSITTQLNSVKNCTFIQEQIVDTQKQIENIDGIMVFNRSQESQQKDQERIVSLQRRLETYQKQLSLCNK